VIDLHCHALPGIDDGPSDIDDAVELARVAAAAGTRTLVATPHIDHSWFIQPATLAGRAAELEGALAAAGVEVEVRTGGEIALTRLMELDEDELDALALGPGRHLLLEAPLTMGAGDFEAIVLSTHGRGRPVVLAHPERCPALLRRPERMQPLIDAGVLMQVTAGSLAGQFGDTIRRTALRWLSAGWVHVVASDAHDAYRRPPDLLGPIECGERDLPGLLHLAPWLTEAVPRAILDGAAIPAPPPLPNPPVERGWLGRLRPRA
jgi:protein-tyrosine phosphatase